ncbi:AI-2E family transporter [Desulfocurvibacter africanus]|uniref:AI-2E family transporter n=1 Tax=Desulfocurvibacter africanus TaxID=873 RepID=UPI002FD90AC8
MSEPATGSEGRHEYVMQLLEAAIRIGLLFLLASWCFLLMQPFIPLLAWGIVIAVAVYPLHARLTIALNGRAGLSATLITLFFLSLLLLPAFILLDSMTRSAVTLYEQVSAGALTVPAPPGKVLSWPVIGNKLHEIWSLAADNLQAVLVRFAPQIRVLGRWLLTTVMGLGFSLLKFCLSLIIAGVVMYKAEAGKLFVDRLFARLIGRRHEEYVAISRDTVRSVALGVVGVAIIQSLLAGMGLFVASIPAAGLWAFLVLLLAIIQIPVLLVLIPVCIYGYSIMSPTAATVLTVWCITVGLLDNVLKPLLFGRGVEIPMLVILMGAIGGMMLTGIIGLFVGAVVLSLGYKLFLIWLDMEST